MNLKITLAYLLTVHNENMKMCIYIQTLRLLTLETKSLGIYYPIKNQRKLGSPSLNTFTYQKKHNNKYYLKKSVMCKVTPKPTKLPRNISLIQKFRTTPYKTNSIN